MDTNTAIAALATENETLAAATAVHPDSGLAWSIDDTQEYVAPGKWRSRFIWAGLTALLCATSTGVAIGAMELVRERETRPAAVAAAPSVSAAAPIPVAPPAQPTPVAAPTVTVTATPPSTTVESAPLSNDDRFLARLNAEGFRDPNQGELVDNAHAVCSSLRRGDSAATVHRNLMAASSNVPDFRITEFITDAMSIYPNCSEE